MSALSLTPYLIVFVSEDKQHYGDFRLAEFFSVLELVGVNVNDSTHCVSNFKLDIADSYLEIYLKGDDIVLKILERCVMVKAVYEIWEQDENAEKLLITLKKKDWKCYEQYFAREISFSIKIETYGRVTKQEQKVELMKQLKFLPLLGKVDLKSPMVTFCILFNYPLPNCSENHLNRDLMIQAYFGRLIGEGQRNLCAHYTLKKRNFLSPTATDACLALLMANQGKVTNCSLVVDPFVGSGSLMIAAAHFKATCIGSDIDYYMVKGKDSVDIRTNFKQYQLVLPEILQIDQSRSPFRLNMRVDAIICDPPYGIRAGAKKVLTIEAAKPILSNKGDFSEPHIPQLGRYEVQDVMIDLLEFAARSLVLQGRLVYLYPTTSEYKDSDLPSHPCLRVIFNSEQILQGIFRRRCITMVKIRELTLEDRAIVQVPDAAHLNLHEKYFKLDENKKQKKQKRIKLDRNEEKLPE